MPVRIGLNGFGGIGRRMFRQALNDDRVVVAAVNDITPPEDRAYLLKYDSTFGTLEEPVSLDGDVLKAAGQKSQMLSEKDPRHLPWDELDIDVVIEATGIFRDGHQAARHIDPAGADKVIISAPANHEDLTIVMGVNHEAYDPERHHVVSNASCTTNCLAPVAKVLNDTFGVKRGLMTTVHAYTASQAILDRQHAKDPRRGRTAADNIVPTSTGAAVAVGLVLPELDGKLDGMALRVPTSSVSVIDLTAEVEQKVTAGEVNEAFKTAAEGPLKGILALNEEPLVSSDFRQDPHSSTVDASSTAVMEDTMVKVVSWYDNEWGYSRRLIDLAVYMVEQSG